MSSFQCRHLQYYTFRNVTFSSCWWHWLLITFHLFKIRAGFHNDLHFLSNLLANINVLATFNKKFGVRYDIDINFPARSHFPKVHIENFNQQSQTANSTHNLSCLDIRDDDISTKFIQPLLFAYYYPLTKSRKIIKFYSLLLFKQATIKSSIKLETTPYTKRNVVIIIRNQNILMQIEWRSNIWNAC